MALKIDHAHDQTGDTLHALIRRESDGLYWDTSDSTFKAWGSISGTNAQVSLTEDSNVSYLYSATVVTTDAAQWTDGIYAIIIRDSSSVIQDQDRAYMRTQDETDLLFDI